MFKILVPPDSQILLVKAFSKNDETNYVSSDQDLLSLGVNTDFSVYLGQYLPLRSINLDVLFNRRQSLLSIVFHLHYIKLQVCQSPRTQSLKVKNKLYLFNHSSAH